MRKLLLILIPVLICSFSGWHYNLDEAKELAKKENKLILLNFSGSDWCGPCINMRHDFFDNETFKSFADTTLILVNADFPRMKKNQLPAQQQAINNSMADRYNSAGKFPFTVLLDANGNVLKEWDGYPSVKPGAFIQQIQNSFDAHLH